jgi:hypothetical protein
MFTHIKLGVRLTMKQCNVKTKICVLGIDLAKQSFQLHGVDENEEPVLKKSLSRQKLINFIANLSPCLIGLEACGGAHHWVRVFTKMGHTVRIMAPQFVKPYVKKMMRSMQRRFVKQYRVLPCDLSQPKALSSKIFKAYTGSEVSLWLNVLHKSIKSVDY